MTTDPDAVAGVTVHAIDPDAFDRYAVVAFGTPEICRDIDEIHALAPPCGLPTLAAHVTVKGTFVEPQDLPEVVARIDRISEVTAPIEIIADRLVTTSSAAGCSVVVLVRPSRALADLHTGLWEALNPLGRTIYARESAGEFTPHLTLVQAIQPAEVPQAMEVIEPRNTDYRFTARTISLVGRRDGTDWETLVDFDLRGGADG